MPDTSARWKQRFTIVGLCAVAFLLCNLDRVNMSIAILPMAEQFQWDSRTMGLVQSSFFWGYLLTQIIGGVLADRIGGKTVLGIGVLWWSLVRPGRKRNSSELALQQSLSGGEQNSQEQSIFSA